MRLAVELSRRHGQRHKRLGSDAGMQLNLALAGRRISVDA